MRAGLKRDYVTFERNNPSQDTTGEIVDSWSLLFYAWVYIRGVKSNEETAIFQIRMRYEPDLLHTDRIVFGSRIFNIVSVLDKDGMERDLQLEVRELV